MNTVIPGAIDITFSDIVEEAYNDYKTKNTYFWSIKANESNAFNKHILPLSDKQKVTFITEAIEKISESNKGRRIWISTDKDRVICSIWDAFMRHLLKSKLVLEDEDITSIISCFVKHPKNDYNNNIMAWPVASLITQVEKQLRDRKASPELIKSLSELKVCIEKERNAYSEKEQAKVIEKLDHLVFKTQNTEGLVKPTWFPGNDEFADYANASIRLLKDAAKEGWFRLMKHSQKASGGSPSKKYLDEGKELFKEFGADKFKLLLNDWFKFIISMKEKVAEHTNNYNGQNYAYTSSEFIAAPNVDLIKGYVWLCVHFHDKATLYNIASLADRCYRKISGKGPAAASIGNASIYVLANSKGLDGVGHLSRLRLRIKQSSTQNLIEKYLYKAAEQQGASIHEIEDMAVDDYGLVHGSKTYEFDDYKAVLKLTGAGKTAFDWFRPDGSLQKSVPAFVKEKYATKLKKIKDTIKQIEITSTAQRDRLDRMFKTERSLAWEQFNEYYFSHGLMSFLTHKLIWSFEQNGRKASAIYVDDIWVNPKGTISLAPGEETKASLWHPVFSSVEEIKNWRTFLIDQKIVQPLKQAFREVYLLTDAEVNTRTYSNRMAAHILKQHQFNSLAKIRGWKYSLLGNFDNGGMNEFASINLPDYGLRAEFWINEVNADGAMNDTGIWLYIATDQVRFVKTDTGDVTELSEVPALAFSEVMRDVDLFVGVASVGNDPQWRDAGGLPAYRDYWQSYSFGDLTEVAKTRKGILERIVPRLKIAKVAEIKDKFLVVKGKLRTYKIHIGSTNILMEPNDQYLCIVPDRSAKNVTENLFLPFEGDSGVSVILSKAMLLADDDKITDRTITSQIKRA